MEFHERESVGLYLDGLQIIEQHHSGLQEICLYVHEQLGKVLVINGEIQHIENYQCLYHEMLIHLPMSFLSAPERAIIFGGGSLFAAKELLKYPSIKTVVLCDHDMTVIEMMKNHYRHAQEVLSDPRFQIVEADMRSYIDTEKAEYDIVVNDCLNLVKERTNSGVPLYNALYAILANDGVCTDVIYRHIFDKETTIESIRQLQKYANTCFALVTVPEYPGILHIQSIWGKNALLGQDQKVGQNAALNDGIIPLEYFDPTRLPFYLYLPPYVQHLFNK